MENLREALGPEKRPTVCFDRGGWSPKLFAELDGAGFDVLGHYRRKSDYAWASGRIVTTSAKRRKSEMFSVMRVPMPCTTIVATTLASWTCFRWTRWPKAMS